MKICTACGKANIMGVEYPYDDPLHYDGISEWRCLSCGTRVGRWSGKVLGEGEGEAPFAGHRGQRQEAVTEDDVEKQDDDPERDLG